MNTQSQHRSRISRLGHTALATAIAVSLAGAVSPASATRTDIQAVLPRPRATVMAANRVMFIDARVPDRARLAAAAVPGTAVVMVDARHDGLTQIADWLQAHRGAHSVAVVAHGAPGELLLGSTTLDVDALARDRAALAAIGRATAPGADLVLFACDTGAGAVGARFVSRLATATGRDVAASDDTTGIDGDWRLEVTRGDIDATPMLQATALVDYPHDLAVTVVTNLNDSGPGSLRQAISDTTGNNQADTIVFDPALFAGGPATLTLTSGALDVAGAGNNDAFTIVGPGANLLTISGNNSSQVFSAVRDHADHTYVNGAANTSPLSISNVTITGGKFQTGTNSSNGYGGGAIVSEYSGNLTLDHVVISGNHNPVDYYSGGGLYFLDQTHDVTISNSSFDDNSASGKLGYGGAARIAASNVTISASTFSGNTSKRSGGAVSLIAYGDRIITNATFSGNTAGSSTDTAAHGGALDIRNGTGSLRIINSTITDNDLISSASTTSGGGGLFIRNTTVTLFNNIIVNNTSDTNGPDVLAYVNGVLNGSNNIIASAVDLRSSLPNPGTNNLTGTITSVPTLGALAWNGGAVQTRSIDAGGSAADAGVTAQAPATDARGYQRGTPVDIGAYEVNDGNAFNFTGSFYPPNGYVNVPNASNLALDFGHPVTAVAGKNIVIHTSNNTVFETIPATDARVSIVNGVGGAASKVVINPSGTFASNAGYYVTIDAGAFTDAAANTFSGVSGSNTWAFTAATLANTAPVVTTSAGTTAFTEGTPVAVDPGLTVADADNPTLASAEVAITAGYQLGEDALAFANDGATMGNISASFNSASGTLTLTSSGASATVAEWQSALRAVTYTDGSDTPDTTSRTVSFSVNDGTVDSSLATKTISVTAVNDAPVVTTTSGETFAPEQTATAIDSGITVSDADNSTLASATVAVTADFLPGEDVLGFSNDGATMGNISATWNATTGVLSLTSVSASATVAEWQAALRAVTFTDTSDTPSTNDRVVSFRVNDGAADSNAAHKNVYTSSSNDAPILATSGGSASFIAGDNTVSTPVVVDGGVTVSDADNTTLASALIAITGNFHAGEDVLAFTNDGTTMGNIAGGYNAATGVMTLTSAGGSATLAQWQSALRAVTYTDTAVSPDPATRTVGFTVSDGSDDSATATRSITVTAVDQSPIVMTTNSTSIDYVSSTAAVVIDGGIMVSDLDNLTQSSAQVSIGSGFHSGDMLGFSNTSSALFGNINASYNAATGMLTLTSGSATATNSQWASALSAVTFSSTSTSYGNRRIDYIISDGVKPSAVVSNTVDVIGLAKVTDVSSTTADGSYKVGDSITLTVTFDQTVTIDTTGGTPSLQLETGSVDRAATYASASGATLTFTYTVQAGDSSADLDYASTAALTLNGATISNSAGAAVLTLPATGSANSIAGQHAIVIDGIAPTVTSVAVPANATYGLGQNLDFTANFSEAVSVDTSGGTPYLAVSLNTGGTVHADYVGPAGNTGLKFRMTVASGEQDLDGIALGSAIVANGATLRDGAGNDADLTLNGVPSTTGVLIDTPLPAYTVTIDDNHDYARYGQMLDYVVSIRNSGDAAATGVVLSGTYSAGFDDSAAHWQCFGGGAATQTNLPHCSPASGSGSVNASIDLPIGASLNFLVSVPVKLAASAADVTASVDLADASFGIDSSASDTNLLVLFRDGFDVPYADGTQAVPGNDAPEPTLATASCDGNGAAEVPVFTLPARVGEELIDRVYQARLASGGQVAVERLNLDDTPWLRLLFAPANGVEQVTGWSEAKPGAGVAIGLTDDGSQRWVLLEGKRTSLRMSLGDDDAGQACH